MRKILLVILTFTFLSACTLNDSTPNISEEKKVPEDINALILLSSELQLIYKDKKNAYLIYQSDGLVEPRLKSKGDQLIILLKDTPKENNNGKRYIYKLTFDNNTENLEIVINGKSVPFDIVSGP
ncbi:hypothetical protein QWY14_10670 [Planococcus sp. N028]|uniref:Lipoprotein n=1 Tax=Planococcus shixiaomingii TaxID=3058393 RepID=A0ABT8N2Z5_9BACL|nr:MULTISPECIES: hypothetical protein [unclassified Planococcus (in: firmicutes)]MDN7242265.1 hypothetical protein [Planococcus sp. N028]WKA54518.1 hypothetical protein QWY21_17900 [Planococcus sp. N022]